jgi:hypothetical protein
MAEDERPGVVALEIEKLERRLSQNGSGGGKGDVEAPGVAEAGGGGASAVAAAPLSDTESPPVSEVLFRRRHTFAALGGMCITIQVRARPRRPPAAPACGARPPHVRGPCSTLLRCPARHAAVMSTACSTAPTQDLTYTVPSNAKRGEVATLLSDITGYFAPSRMSALMVGGAARMAAGGPAWRWHGSGMAVAWRRHGAGVAAGGCMAAAWRRHGSRRLHGDSGGAARGMRRPWLRVHGAHPRRRPPHHPSQGPSGSGKTTLLDLMAGRKTTGKTKGEILFAGNKPTRPFLRRYTGYVRRRGGGPRGGAGQGLRPRPPRCAG